MFLIYLIIELPSVNFLACIIVCAYFTSILKNTVTLCQRFISILLKPNNSDIAFLAVPNLSKVQKITLLVYTYVLNIKITLKTIFGVAL